jgi:hypothetical protein
MFVQVIRGAVSSAPDAMEMLDRWMDEVRPQAVGWLGTTAGVTDDGELLAIVRFASVEEARRNSDLPQQSTWWTEMEKQYAGTVRFYDCDDVATFLDGGSDDAGFVQVMEWSTAGSRDAAALADMAGDLVRQHRPDVLGGLVAIADDGTTFQAVYFTSEEDARRAEATEMPEEVLAEMDELLESVGDPAYHDLRSPTLVS